MERRQRGVVRFGGACPDTRLWVMTSSDSNLEETIGASPEEEQNGAKAVEPAPDSLNAGEVVLTAFSTSAAVAGLFVLPRAAAIAAFGLFVLTVVLTLKRGRRSGAAVAVVCLLAAAWLAVVDTRSDQVVDAPTRADIHRIDKRLKELRELLIRGGGAEGQLRVALRETRHEILSTINNLRAGSGAEALRLSRPLSKTAQQWSAHLAAINDVQHDPALGDTEYEWATLAQSIGVGHSWRKLLSDLNNNASHRAVLQSDARDAGIGISIGAAGRVYLVMNIAKPG